MRTLTAIAVALLLPAVPAMAQDKSAPAKFALSKDQLAKIQQINARYDAQVKAAFADDKAVPDMQADLKKIDAEKDPAKKASAIAAYQSKYAKTYKAALARGKVNLNSWAAELRTVMPAYTFSVKDGTHITALATSSSPDEPVVPAAAPATTTQNLRSTDFEFVRERGCAPIGGNNVTQSGMNMTNETWAAEFGGCTNYGTLTYGLNVPADQRALVEMKASLNVDVFAVGVLAFTFSAGHSTIRIMSEGDYKAYKSFYCSAAALFLYAASESCGRDRAPVSKRLNAAGAYQVEADTFTEVMAGGIVAASTASATVRDFSAKITLEPR